MNPSTVEIKVVFLSSRTFLIKFQFIILCQFVKTVFIIYYHIKVKLLDYYENKAQLTKFLYQGQQIMVCDTMAEEDKNLITPAVCVYHDAKNYSIEVELPGVEKKDIDFEMSENWFCIKAPRKEESFTGCWVLAHDIKPDEAKAKFDNGLLIVSVPLEEIASEGMRINVE